jgi:hypothetical protein
VQNIFKKLFIAVLKFLRYDQHCFSNVSKANILLISHQQALVEHWDLPNTEIFQYKYVASVLQVNFLFKRTKLSIIIGDNFFYD